MQAVSAAYAAQVEAGSQAPAARVSIDWLRTSEGPYYTPDTGDFEGGLGSWTGTGSNPPTLTTSTTGACVSGAAHMVVTLPTGFGSVTSSLTPGLPLRLLISGQVYTASVWVLVPTGVTPFDFGGQGAAEVIGRLPTTTINDVYQQLYVTFRAGTGNVPLLSPAGATTAGQTISVDDFRFYRGPLTPTVGGYTPADFDEINTRRSISGGLPAEVTLTSGVSTATATIGLTGVPTDNALTAGVLYSPYQPGNTRVQVEGTPVRVEAGQNINGVPELFTVLDGQIRDLSVSAGSDGTTASMGVVDKQSRFGFVPVLDQMVGNDPVIPASGLPQKPGLDVQRVVDEVARQAGYYASPPTRAQALVSATLHGSAWPEVGTLRTASYWDSVSTSTAFPVRFAPARFALGMEEQVTNFAGQNNLAQWSFTPQNQNNLDHMYYEGWHYLTPTLNDDLGAVYETAGITRRIFWRMDGTGKLGLHWSRNGVAYADSFPTAAQVSTSGWQYVAWHITYDSPNTTIRIRVGATLDTIVTATPSTFTGSAVGVLAVYNHGSEAVQLTAEPYSASMFNDGFVPNSVLEPGLSELTAVPPLASGTDGRTILQDIANATAAVALLDEPGVFRYWNRQHWATAPAATTIQRTLRASVPLKTATVEQLADRIRTIVRATVTPLRITAATVQPILAEVKAVPARGSLAVSVDLSPNQGYQVGTTTGIIPSGGAIINGLSGYRAARRFDGSGGEIANLTMTVASAADSVTVTWTNPNAYPAWLVTPSAAGYPAGSVGLPAADLVLRLITATAQASDTTDTSPSAVLVEYRDEQAIADLGGSPAGERPIVLDASPWLQSTDDGYRLVRDLGYLVARPCPQLSSVQILADPALQLGDLVLLADDSAVPGRGSATGINDLFWVVGVSGRHTATEATQDLTLRPVVPPGSLLFRDAGMPDRSTLDGRWHLA
jgi:hypothetical protein